MRFSSTGMYCKICCRGVRAGVGETVWAGATLRMPGRPGARASVNSGSLHMCLPGWPSLRASTSSRAPQRRAATQGAQAASAPADGKALQASGWGAGWHAAQWAAPALYQCPRMETLSSKPSQDGLMPAPCPPAKAASKAGTAPQTSCSGTGPTAQACLSVVPKRRCILT